MTARGRRSSDLGPSARQPGCSASRCGQLATAVARRSTSLVPGTSATAAMSGLRVAPVSRTRMTWDASRRLSPIPGPGTPKPSAKRYSPSQVPRLWGGRRFGTAPQHADRLPAGSGIDLTYAECNAVP